MFVPEVDEDPGRHYRCSCFIVNLLPEFDEEEEYYTDTYEQINLDEWESCLDTSVFFPYFSLHTQKYSTFFKQHLHYVSENRKCKCYWPYISKLSCNISDKVYDSFSKIISKSCVRDYIQETINFPMTYINKEEKKTTLYSSIEQISHDFLHQVLFLHCFFYSQYRSVCLDLCKYVDSNSLNGSSDLNSIYKSLYSVQPLFLKLYDDCLQKHPHPKILYERGMIYFHQGRLMDAASDIEEFVDWATEHNEDLLDSDLYLQEGISYAELGLYDEAVKALSKSIEKDPKNKDAYFERATVYFEKGDFEKSIEDFLLYGEKPTKIDLSDLNNIVFGAGLIKSTAVNAGKSALNFFPDLFSLGVDLTSGLGSFASTPIECSKEMAKACKEIAALLQDNNTYENLKVIIPEIGDLIDKWDSSNSFEKGELFGIIIGKYGTDLLMAKGCAKIYRAYRDLRKANNLMKIDYLAKTFQKNQLSELTFKWKKRNDEALNAFKADIGKKELYKELRHISCETQLRKELHKRGIKTFKRPKGIPGDWKVKLTKRNGGIKYYKDDHNYIRVMPGDPKGGNTAQKKPYIIQKKDGVNLNKFGEVVDKKSLEAHIHLKEFKFKQYDK